MRRLRYPRYTACGEPNRFPSRNRKERVRMRQNELFEHPCLTTPFDYLFTSPRIYRATSFHDSTRQKNRPNTPDRSAFVSRNVTDSHDSPFGIGQRALFLRCQFSLLLLGPRPELLPTYLSQRPSLCGFAVETLKSNSRGCAQ